MKYPGRAGRYRDDDPDYQDFIAEKFRCPSCETPTFRGRWCDQCRDERDRVVGKADAD